jgi:hypothetical protein
VHYNTDGWQIYAGGNSFDINGAIQFERFGCDVIDGTTDLRDNEWHYISIVIENEVISIFIDGQLEIAVSNDSCLPTNGNNSSSNEIFIGEASHDHNGVENFPGKIDNITIWHKSLSNQEIQYYMNCPPNGDEEDLVGYWNFEEGEGETVIDLSGNGNDGTIDGPTYSSDVPEQSCQLQTINGCDSVAVLNLTINQPDTSYSDITACESYEWNGQTYTESGIYNLSSNLDNEIQGFTYIGAFENSFYYISNNNLDWINSNIECLNNGGQLASFSSQEENDSVFTMLSNVNTNEVNFWIGLYQNTLNLDFSEPNQGWEWINNDNVDFTNWYLNQPNNIILNENYAYLMLDGSGMWNDAVNNNNFKCILEVSSNLFYDNGCDSVEVLNLTITQPDTSYTDVTACDSYEWDGQTYFESGVYTNAYTNINGCDSIVSLDLTISYSGGSIFVNTCDSYEWNGDTLH